MDRYSLIVMTGETSPIRRFELPRQQVRRAVWAGAVVAALLLVGLVDYVRVRVEHAELGQLRVENADQRQQIESFDDAVAEVEQRLIQVRELERKVRIIANLPGSAAAGGADVVERRSDAETPGGEGGALPAEIDVETAPQAGPGAPAAPGPGAAARAGAARDAVRLEALHREAGRLAGVAEQRRLSLLELVQQLEDKHERLASSPAIWPTEGWLTSRFGTRISPFTGRRQFHAGIDIAGAAGSPVVATARGQVVFVGAKGPLGKTVILDHGYGVRTHYGHNRTLEVEKGQKVERGQVIASLGNSGRSTGPHIHYTVEVKGKAVNPLDYIFD